MLLVTKMGPEQWGEAANAFEEALRLEPENSIHLAQKAQLQRLRGVADADSREALWKEAEELLRQAINWGKPA